MIIKVISCVRHHNHNKITIHHNKFFFIRDIVIKAIDLWCKPDPPEDNFEEDASGWGSGDEVRITLFTIFLDRLGELVGG